MTITPSKARRSRARPHAKVRRARQAQSQQQQCLVQQIIDEGATSSAQAASAALVTTASLSDAELQTWHQDLQGRLEHIRQHSEQNLGFIEEQIALATKEPLRLLAQRAAQAKANATPCQCQDCQTDLLNKKYLARTIDSRFGPLKVYRSYGWCSDCEVWHFPADHALGLGKNAPASPYVQEMAALLGQQDAARSSCFGGRTNGAQALALLAPSRSPPPGPQSGGRPGQRLDSTRHVGATPTSGRRQRGAALAALYFDY